MSSSSSSSSSSDSSDSEEEVKRNRTANKSTSSSSSSSSPEPEPQKDKGKKRTDRSPSTSSSSSSSSPPPQIDKGKKRSPRRKPSPTPPVENDVAKNGTSVEETDVSTPASWTAKDKLSLLEGILDQIRPRDMTPFDMFKVNWKRVHTDLPKEDCAKMWEDLKSKARQYRTVREVAEELVMFETESPHASVEGWNSKINTTVKTNARATGTLNMRERGRAKPKTPRQNAYPDYYPPKAQSTYDLYKRDMFKQLKERGVPSKDYFKKLSENWNKIDAEKKKEYEAASHESRLEYVEKMEEYSQKNPEDTKITRMIQLEKDKLKKYEGIQYLDVSDNHKIDEYLNKTATSITTSSDTEPEKRPKKTSSPKKKLVLTSEKEKTPKSSLLTSVKRKISASEFDSELEETLKNDKTVLLSESEEEVQKPRKKSKIQASSDQTDSPSSPKKKKKIKLEQTEDSSPVKSPKKKKKKVWTGVDMFLELRRDVYKHKHSDLDEERLLTKMRSKYERLPEHKQKKYEKQAEQRNNAE